MFSIKNFPFFFHNKYTSRQNNPWFSISVNRRLFLCIFHFVEEAFLPFSFFLFSLGGKGFLHIIIELWKVLLLLDISLCTISDKIFYYLLIDLDVVQDELQYFPVPSNQQWWRNEGIILNKKNINLSVWPSIA